MKSRISMFQVMRGLAIVLAVFFAPQYSRTEGQELARSAASKSRTAVVMLDLVLANGERSKAVLRVGAPLSISDPTTSDVSTVVMNELMVTLESPELVQVRVLDAQGIDQAALLELPSASSTLLRPESGPLSELVITSLSWEETKAVPASDCCVVTCSGAVVCGCAISSSCGSCCSGGCCPGPKSFLGNSVADVNCGF